MKTILDYADLVKEQHALNTIIAPVETDLTSASKAYAVGQKFIHDGVLYQAKTAIAQGAALVLNTNYEAADDVSSEIQTLTQEVDTIVNDLSAKNILNPKYNGTTTGTGITFVDSKVGPVTLSGTASGANTFYIAMAADNYKLPTGKYIVSKGNDDKSYMSIAAYNNTTWVKNLASITDNEAEFEIDYNGYDRLAISIQVLNGTEITSPITAKPMIRPASIKNSDYVQFAMTNRELTENISGKYIFEQWDKWFQVTADGTKTLATLFKELADAIVGYAQTMPTSDEMTLQYLAADGYGARPNITKITNIVTSLTNVAEGLIVGSNGAVSLTRNVISTTLASCAQVVTSISPDGTVTVTPRTTNIPANGTVLVVRASIYRKIA